MPCAPMRGARSRCRRAPVRRWRGSAGRWFRARRRTVPAHAGEAGWLGVGSTAPSTEIAAQRGRAPQVAGVVAGRGERLVGERASPVERRQLLRASAGRGRIRARSGIAVEQRLDAARAAQARGFATARQRDGSVGARSCIAADSGVEGCAQALEPCAVVGAGRASPGIRPAAATRRPPGGRPAASGNRPACAAAPGQRLAIEAARRAGPRGDVAHVQSAGALRDSVAAPRSGARRPSPRSRVPRAIGEASAASADSPGSTLPPGNSHRPDRSRPRCAAPAGRGRAHRG